MLPLISSKCLVSTVFIVLFTMQLEAQKAEKDTIMAQINNRLGIITSTIDSNKRVLADSIRTLHQKMQGLDKELQSFRGKEQENKNKVEDLEFSKSDLLRQLEDAKRNNQGYAKQMIKAITLEPNDINEELVVAILEFARSTVSPDLTTIEHYVKAYRLLNGAYNYLERTYEADSVKFYVTKLKDFGWKTYPLPAMESSKEKVKLLLEKYCTKFNRVVTEIIDTKSMTESSRSKILEDIKYEVDEYKFLKDLIDRAIQKNDVSLSKVTCN